MELQSITPKSGPLAGETEIQISGNGFGTTHHGVTVAIGNKECKVTSVNSSLIKCLTPGEGEHVIKDVVVRFP